MRSKADTRGLSVPRKRARPRKAKAGRSEAARALGRLRAETAGSEEMARIGRLGAEARWGRKILDSDP